ncbi:hypothetical protein POM88_001441 [Heracleum sosnowskyi]|uniref:Cytochrome b561 domain-containing protein n=1 Tax=Heracleum sosnowskyi TaxID=360622 RepID=A0AAD8NAU4_9APIA|nr:hypothetical protein POM88_001441 [Heracleum sosnowskyi]
MIIQICSDILSVLLVTTGAVLSIRKFENTFNNTHQKMGLALYGVIWLQALTGFFRPERGHVGRQHMARKWKWNELRRAENGGIRTIRFRGMSVSLAGPYECVVKGGIVGLLGGGGPEELDMDT